MKLRRGECGIDERPVWAVNDGETSLICATLRDGENQLQVQNDGYCKRHDRAGRRCNRGSAPLIIY